LGIARARAGPAPAALWPPLCKAAVRWNWGRMISVGIGGFKGGWAATAGCNRAIEWLISSGVMPHARAQPAWRGGPAWSARGAGC
jgi:hypothetical protein